jgi:hypothetical protein
MQCETYAPWQVCAAGVCAAKNKREKMQKIFTKILLFAEKCATIEIYKIIQ